MWPVIQPSSLHLSLKPRNIQHPYA